MPVCERFRVFREARVDLDNGAADGLNALGAKLLVNALGENQARLPIVKTIQDDKHAAAANAAQCATRDLRVRWKLGKAEPENIHGRRGFHRIDTGETTKRREAAVGSHGERSANFVAAIGAEVAHAANNAIFFDKALDLSMHQQTELRILGGLACKEFEKARLRNHQDIGETSFETRKVERAEGAAGKTNCRAGNFAVRDVVDGIGQADLVENLHR